MKRKNILKAKAASLFTVAVVLSLILFVVSACAPTVTEPVVVDDIECTSHISAVDNIRKELVILGYEEVTFTEAVVLTSADAVAFAQVIDWDGGVDEVRAWYVSGAGLRTDMTYIVVLNDGCVVTDNALTYDILAELLRSTAEISKGI